MNYCLRILHKIFRFINYLQVKALNAHYKSKLQIHSTVHLGRGCHLDERNISIGEGTYIRQAEIFSGKAKVRIGKFCAIGKNVSIKARTHDLKRPTPNINHPMNLRKYLDIAINDHVWIGDNVFIKEGVTIGSYAVIAANSVVVNDVEDYMIVGGVPARNIRINHEVMTNHA